MKKSAPMRIVVVLAVLSFALAGCGAAEETDEAAADQPVTVTETVTRTETAPAEPEAQCSTADLRLTLPEQDVPEPVAQLRQRIFAAAVACDYVTLGQIAAEDQGFTFSYGAETSAADHWRQVEEAGVEQPLPMRALAAILTMPYTRNETGSYAWPTAYSESPTAEAWQALVDTGLYSQEQVDLMQAQNTGYLGYRTAITPDGTWQFFVAGD